MSLTSKSLTEGSIDVDTLEESSISMTESGDTLEVLSVSSEWFSDYTNIQQSLNSSLLTADSDATYASVEVCFNSESDITASPDPVVNRQEGSKRRGLCVFFQKTWKTVKRPFFGSHRTRVEPIVPPLQPNTRASDPELTSDLETQSSVKLSNTYTVKNSPMKHHTKGRQRRGLSAFFQKTWKTVKRPFLCRRNNKVEPFVPPLQLDTHAADPEIMSVRCTSSLEQRHDREQTDSSVWLEQTPDTSQSPDTDLAVSELPFVSGDVNSHYKVGCLLGAGGFGTVYEGTRRSDGQKVAIKFIHKLVDDRYLVIPGHSEPLLTEVALMLLMKQEPISPYVIQMFEWFEDPRNITIVMELPYPCESLNDFIFRHDVLIEKMAGVLMHQAVLAVQHCIQHGVFHNDIHTDNILVNPCTLQLKLIDFGCGQLFSGAAYKRRQYKGAAAYCPPEVPTNPTFHAIPANVWSLGLILFEMVNGCLPYDGSEEVLFVNPDLSRGWTQT